MSFRLNVPMRCKTKILLITKSSEAFLVKKDLLRAKYNLPIVTHTLSITCQLRPLHYYKDKCISVIIHYTSLSEQLKNIIFEIAEHPRFPKIKTVLAISLLKEKHHCNNQLLLNQYKIRKLIRYH